MKKNQNGFVLIELVVVLGIMLILFGLGVFNLIGTEKSTKVTSASNALISDMASQQTKAMLGAGVTGGLNYGIHFQNDRYVLFQGDSYSPSDSNNFTVMLDQGLVINNILMPANSNLIFTLASGTVSGYLNGNNYGVTIQNSDGQMPKTLIVNRYGIVIQEN